MAIKVLLKPFCRVIDARNLVAINRSRAVIAGRLQADVVSGNGPIDADKGAERLRPYRLYVGTPGEKFIIRDIVLASERQYSEP